jgi:large subunit ribosomal protein L6
MFEKTVEIPEGIDVSRDGNLLVVKGNKGELSRVFKDARIKISIENSTVRVSSEEERRKPKALVGTWAALIRNMIGGVQSGWEARLKVVYSHFPVKFSTEGNTFVIQNFLGEKNSRKAKIIEGTQVKAEKDEIIITGIDREKVGQTAANIEIAAKVTGFDRRVFQDGCHLMQKAARISEEHGQ